MPKGQQWIPVEEYIIRYYIQLGVEDNLELKAIIKRIAKHLGRTYSSVYNKMLHMKLVVTVSQDSCPEMSSSRL